MSTSNKEHDICKMVFTKLDSNGDGKIDFNEFKKAFWTQGSNIEEKSLREAFDAADLNKDGRIDQQELCKYFKK